MILLWADRAAEGRVSCVRDTAGGVPRAAGNVGQGEQSRTDAARGQYDHVLSTTAIFCFSCYLTRVMECFSVRMWAW
jgi:hypothetical protein